MDDLVSLSNRIAVVGVGNTPYGAFPEEDEYSLGTTAFRNALNDCGLEKSKVDGLLVCRIPSYVRMGEILRLWGCNRPQVG